MPCGNIIKGLLVLFTTLIIFSKNPKFSLVIISLSIAIELIKKLLRKKVKITIHDPKALENTRKIFGNKINYSRSVGDALSKSQCVILMTQWKQYD